MSPIVSKNYELVVGVDTHDATHTLALLAAATGHSRSCVNQSFRGSGL